jgi:hypothetical protein
MRGRRIRRLRRPAEVTMQRILDDDDLRASFQRLERLFQAPGEPGQRSRFSRSFARLILQNPRNVIG